jgi:hypothetical protein
MDLYRDGEKVEVREIGPPISASAALNRAEGHTKRVERWHSIQSRNDR